jgi:putative ABC transport system permease protein
MGIDEKDKINIRLQGLEFQKLAHEIRKLTGVISVGGVSHRLGTWDDHSADYRRSPADEAFVLRDFFVDENYVTNLDLTFLAGENFKYLTEGPIEKHVILNEKALPMFNFTDPLSAIGQTIFVQDSTELTVIGVVRDFHFRPLSYEIGPLALRYNLNELNILSAKIEPGKGEVLYSSLEAVWRKLDPIHPFEAKMMEAEIDDAYTDAGLKDILKIVSYVSLLAVSLACLGMLGMAMYSTQTRKKEIGVRKVMGATSAEIAFQLSRSFLSLIGIAAALGGPIGYLSGGIFLQQYAYKAPVSILLFAGGMLGIAVFGAIFIASQTWKAALANPVNSLKYE